MTRTPSVDDLARAWFVGNLVSKGEPREDALRRWDEQSSDMEFMRQKYLGVAWFALGELVKEDQ